MVLRYTVSIQSLNLLQMEASKMFETNFMHMNLRYVIQLIFTSLLGV